MSTAARPRRILDLDTKPRSTWRLDSQAVHLYQGKLWQWQKVGCILCMTEDEGDVEFQTLKGEDGTSTCLTHGELETVPYSTHRSYEIIIGEKTIRGACRRNTVIYVPINVTGNEREEILVGLANESKDLEIGDFNDCDSPEC